MIRNLSETFSCIMLIWSGPGSYPLATEGNAIDLMMMRHFFLEKAKTWTTMM